MFRKLKHAIESALDALEGRAGESSREDIDKLLRAMREELIETRARIPKIEKQLEELRVSHDREVREAEDCHRRATQAEAIGDAETVEVALRFEAKHRVAIDVWIQKIEAADAELLMQRRTVEEMTTELKAAMARRESLEIQARRTGSTGRMRGDRYSSVDEFDRLADGIEREVDLGAARRSVNGEVDPGAAGPDDLAVPEAGTALSREELAELQLDELKRRMEREKGGT